MLEYTSWILGHTECPAETSQHKLIGVFAEHICSLEGNAVLQLNYLQPDKYFTLVMLNKLRFHAHF